MNNKIILLSVVLLSLLFGSCATVQTTAKVNSKYGEAKQLDVYGHGVTYTPVIADLEVKPSKVTASASQRDGIVSKLKKAALFNAVEKSKADVIVEPIYVVERNDRDVKVTVKGYPAFYKNFRNLKTSDLEIIEKLGPAKRPQLLNVGQSSTTTTTTTTKKGLFGLGIFGL